MNSQQTALRKANRHHGTVIGNVLRHPIVDSHRCGERVTVQILAGIGTQSWNQEYAPGASGQPPAASTARAMKRNRCMVRRIASYRPSPPRSIPSRAGTGTTVVSVRCCRRRANTAHASPAAVRRNGPAPRPIRVRSAPSCLLVVWFALLSIASLIPSQYSVRLRHAIAVRRGLRKSCEKRRPRWDRPPGRERREKKKGFNCREL